MGGININGVLKGGLAAALIMNISQYLLRLMIAANAEGRLTAVVVRTTALAIATVWLYAAIRPRFGPGPKTAICAGLVVWALSYVFPAILGDQSMGAVVVIIAWTGVEMLIASSVGGYLYHES
jgi:putative Ca2+/H+ antiporter (TMEM165/GDT1 family)